MLNRLGYSSLRALSPHQTSSQKRIFEPSPISKRAKKLKMH
jgi:hypothetical protein